MKNLLLLLLVLFTLQSSAQWNQLTGPEGSGLYCIAKTSQGIYCGTSGGLYISQNEGQTWQKINSINDYEISNIVSVNDTLIAIYKLYNSTTSKYEYYSISSFDNATTWNVPTMYENTPSQLTGTSLFAQGHTLFTNGQWDNYYSLDYGQTWVILQSPNSDNISSQSFYGNYLLVSTFNSTTYHRERFVSAFGSLNWQQVDTFPNPIYTAMIDSIIFTAVPSSPYNLYLRSYDFGQHWDTLFTTPDTVYIGLYSEDNNLYQFTQQGIYYVSTDLGNTWNPSQGFKWYASDQRIPISNGDLLAVKYNEGLIHYVTATDTFYSAVTGILSQVCSFLRTFNGVIYVNVSGGFYSSQNGGLTWTKLNTMLSGVRNMMVSGDTIVCVSDNTLSRSIDNGVTWDTAVVPQSQYLDAPGIEIIGSRVYYAGVKNYYSDDLGDTWHITADIIPDSLACISTADNGILRRLGNDLFIVTNEGMIYRYDPVNDVWIYSLCFWSPGAHTGNYIYRVDSCLVVSGYSEMFTSCDHGITWTSVSLTGIPLDNLGSPIVPRSIVSSNGLWFGSCGSAGIFASSDQGGSWTQIPVSGFTPSGITLLNDVLYSSTRGKGIWKRDGTFRAYSGKVYLDNNQNNIFDAGDVAKKQVLITTNPSSHVASTDSLGNYHLVTDALGDIISPNSISQYVNILPSQYVLDTVQLQNLDFSLQVNATVSDFAVDITAATGFRYASTTLFYLTVTNNGTIKQNGTASMYIPAAQLSYVSSTPSPLSINGDTITWNIDSLDFLEKASVEISILTLSSNNISDSVSCSASVIPSVPDTLPGDNFFTYSDIVRGAFDPNDKTCLEGEIITTQEINNGQKFDYIVRFQNTGNLTATKVVIVDSLNHFLDWSTLNVISSSHPVTWSINENGVVNFEFANINLPDSNVDEMNSHGFVKYQLDPRNQLQSGNVISNVAYIYFDSNPAIVTNTVLTTVVDQILLQSPVINFNKDVSVLVYPNPAREEFNLLVQGDNNQKIVNIYNSFGKLMLSQRFYGTELKINSSSLENGLYIGEVISEGGNRFSAFRLVIGR